MQFLQRTSLAMIGLHKAAFNATFNMVFRNYCDPISFCVIHDTKKSGGSDNPMSAGFCGYPFYRGAIKFPSWEGARQTVKWQGWVSTPCLRTHPCPSQEGLFLSRITVDSSRIFVFNSHGLTISAMSPYIISQRTKPSINPVRKVISIIPSTSFSETKPL